MSPDRRILNRIVRRIVVAAHPLKIILFGSAARGTYTKDSDLDFLVVVPDGTRRNRVARAIYRNMIGLIQPVDIVMATESDLQNHADNFSLIYYPALREGREVYGV